MTEPERQALRAKIDQAKRVVVQEPEFVSCAYTRCTRLFAFRPRKRFCSHVCRSAAWQRTDQGREVYNRWRRGWDKRRRAEARA